jgi:hypothetical protein
MSKKTPWRNRIVGSGELPASEFLANPGNWRIHPKPQQCPPVVYGGHCPAHPGEHPEQNAGAYKRN